MKNIDTKLICQDFLMSFMKVNCLLTLTLKVKQSIMVEYTYITSHNKTNHYCRIFYLKYIFSIQQQKNE